MGVILFSKTDALGDQLLATGPLLTLLERDLAARLLWIVREPNAAIGTLLPGAGRVHVDLSRPPVEEAGRVRETMQSTHSERVASRISFLALPLNPYALGELDAAFIRTILWWRNFVRALAPEVAIAGTVSLNWLDRLLVAQSGASQRIAYVGSPDEQALPPAVAAATADADQRAHPAFTHPAVIEEECREADHLARLIAAAGCECPQEGPAITLTLPANARTGVVVAPGAGDPQKIYPLPNIAAALRELSTEEPLGTITILCGPLDEAPTQELAGALEAAGLPATIARMPVDDLRPAASLLNRTRLLICNDTFWVHLAGVLRTPTVVLWGQGHAFRFLPREGNIHVLHMDMACRECSWNCCFPTRRCITDIPTETIVRSARQLLTGTPNNTVALFGHKSPLSFSTIRGALLRQAKRSEILQHRLNLLGAQLADLQGNFEAVEKDRDERGEIIEAQGKRIASLEKEVDLRLKTLTELYQQIEEQKNQRNLLKSQLVDLERNFDGAERDRIARGAVIDRQGQELSALQREFDRRLTELRNLYDTAELIKNERNLLSAQLADLRRNFDAVESDRIARGAVIEQQGRRIAELEKLVHETIADRDAWKQRTAGPQP